MFHVMSLRNTYKTSLISGMDLQNNWVSTYTVHVYSTCKHAEKTCTVIYMYDVYMYICVIPFLHEICLPSLAVNGKLLYWQQYMYMHTLNYLIIHNVLLIMLCILDERWLVIKGLQGYWVDFECRVGGFLNWVTEEAKTFSREVTSTEGEKGVVDHMRSCKVRPQLVDELCDYHVMSRLCMIL